jgi:hypothetical protein
MGRITAALGLGAFLIVAAATPGTGYARQDGDDAPSPRLRRAYKPAERRQQQDQDQEEAVQAARRTPAPAPAPSNDDSSIPPNVTDPEAYKKELDAARDQRDRDLKDAAKETDRRKFEKRKEEIFARYASIVAAMRDKYEAHQAETGETLQQPQRTGKNSKTAAVRPGSTDRSGTTERPGRPESRQQRTVRRDDADARADSDTSARGKAKTSRKRAGDDADETLDEAWKRLDDENARHDAATEQLNKQLADAQASKDKREIRKAERAIDKENTAYEAKKSMLESRVKELGGTIGGKAGGKAGAAPAVR